MFTNLIGVYVDQPTPPAIETTEELEAAIDEALEGFIGEPVTNKVKHAMKQGIAQLIYRYQATGGEIEFPPIWIWQDWIDPTLMHLQIGEGAVSDDIYESLALHLRVKSITAGHKQAVEAAFCEALQEDVSVRIVQERIYLHKGSRDEDE